MWQEIYSSILGKTRPQTLYKTKGPLNALFEINTFQVDDLTFLPVANGSKFSPQTWMHTCVSIDSALNHVIIVADGQQLEDKTFPIPAGAKPPKNLAGKLYLLKSWLGFWHQPI